MELRRATESDNERLLEYFSQATLHGPVGVKIRRMSNFFNQYRLQSDEFETYMLLNDDDKIEGLATLIFRDAVIDGARQKVGYATDLRISPTRGAVLSWSQHFLPVIEQARELHGCKYFFSTVAGSQRQAYNAFIRPRNLRRRLPRYHLFRRLQIVSLHGIWPFHPSPLPGIRIRSAESKDLPQLTEYIMRKSALQPLRFIETASDFVHNLEQWQDLTISNFLLAFDKANNLIGCVAPWSPERVQRFYVDSYEPNAKNLQDIAQVLSWFSIAHPLPAEENELELRFLTHLYADNPDIFYSLLYNAYQNSGKRETLLYAHFDGDLTSLPPRSFLSAELPYGFYCILSPQDPIPEFLRPKMTDTPPAFEPALI